MNVDKTRRQCCFSTQRSKSAWHGQMPGLQHSEQIVKHQLCKEPSQEAWTCRPTCVPAHAANTIMCQETRMACQPQKMQKMWVFLFCAQELCYVCSKLTTSYGIHASVLADGQTYSLNMQTPSTSALQLVTWCVKDASLCLSQYCLLNWLIKVVHKGQTP